MGGFTWVDGERTISFGRGTIEGAGDLLGEGYTLLTTERATALAPQVAERAASVHHVAPGLVDELSEELLGTVGEGCLVALGGGRVIDVAKSIGAVRGTDVAAIPTTLSAAEMTASHRLPPSAPSGTRMIRPVIVVNDPDLCASQPAPELAASAANSLAHAIEGSLTTRASPVPSLAAREAQRLIDVAFLVEGEEPTETAREQLALAALLSGYVIDSTGYGLHHVLAQSVVREGGAAHAHANAALLEHTIGALDRRSGGRADRDGSLRELARRLAVAAGAARLRDTGVARESLDAVARAAAQRGQLDLTPPRADETELREILEAAW